MAENHFASIGSVSTCSGRCPVTMSSVPQNGSKMSSFPAANAPGDFEERGTGYGPQHGDLLLLHPVLAAERGVV